MEGSGEEEGRWLEEEEDRGTTDILQYSVRRGGCGKSVRKGGKKAKGMMCECVCVCVLWWSECEGGGVGWCVCVCECGLIEREERESVCERVCMEEWRNQAVRGD